MAAYDEQHPATAGDLPPRRSPATVASETAMPTLTRRAGEVADPVEPSADAWVTR